MFSIIGAIEEKKALAYLLSLHTWDGLEKQCHTMKILFPQVMYLILLFIPRLVSTTLFRPKGYPVWAIPEGEVINIMKKGCLQNIPSTIWILTKFISSYDNNINLHIHWNQHVWRPACHIFFSNFKSSINKFFFWKSKFLYRRGAVVYFKKDDFCVRKKVSNGLILTYVCSCLSKNM